MIVNIYKLLHKYPHLLIPSLVITITGAVILFTAPDSQAQENAEPVYPEIEFIASPYINKTLTHYEETTITITKPIPFETEIVEDPELEKGIEEIVQEGVQGSSYQTYLITTYEGVETDNTLISEEITEPTPEVIKKGTKIVIREMDTPYGRLSYSQTLHVYAMPYTLESAGGYGYTASGTVPHYGTIAVDPTVIPLGTKMYIPGYGIGTAEDTGGAIQGNIIDLFYEGNHGWWNSQYLDIYILTQ